MPNSIGTNIKSAVKFSAESLKPAAKVVSDIGLEATRQVIGTTPPENPASQANTQDPNALETLKPESVRLRNVNQFLDQLKADAERLKQQRKHEEQMKSEQEKLQEQQQAKRAEEARIKQIKVTKPSQLSHLDRLKTQTERKIKGA